MSVMAALLDSVMEFDSSYLTERESVVAGQRTDV